MTRLDSSNYLDHIATESCRFREILTNCDATASVPSCPEWAADDLLWHLTEVQTFWAWIINNRPSDPDDYEEPVRPTDHSSLLVAFDEASSSLVHALSSAAADEPAWSWDDEQTVGFTLRRQAHEALIHRVDAEQTARFPSTLDLALAADGIDEVLRIFYGGCPPWATHSLLPYVVEVVVTDTRDSIFVQPGHFSGTGPESGTVYDREGMIEVMTNPTPADATIAGAASDVLLWLWDRADNSRLTMSGDAEALDAFAAAVSSSID